MRSRAKPPIGLPTKFPTKTHIITQTREIRKRRHRRLAHFYGLVVWIILVIELKMDSGGKVDSKSQAMWRATHAIVGRVVPFNGLLPILR